MLADKTLAGVAGDAKELMQFIWSNRDHIGHAIGPILQLGAAAVPYGEDAVVGGRAAIKAADWMVRHTPK